MAFRFDAATDRLVYSAAGVPDPASVAGITMVMQTLVSVDRNEYSTMARLSASGSTSITFATMNDGLGGPGYYTSGGSIEHTLGFGAAGNYRKLAFTCASNAASVYAAVPDGATQVASGAVSGATAPNMVCLGGRSDTDTTEWFNGRLMCVRMWAAVLTQAQIEAEWASILAVRTANLYADWPLLTVGDLRDYSGNGRTLTAGSTAVVAEADPQIGDGSFLPFLLDAA